MNEIENQKKINEELYKKTNTLQAKLNKRNLHINNQLNNPSSFINFGLSSLDSSKEHSSKEQGM